MFPFATRRSIRRGGVTVEMAIVGPLAFFFFFAAFEFCRVAMIRHTADNAVYEACRQAMIPGGTATAARDEARSILNTLGIGSYSVTVLPQEITAATREVTVRVRVPLDGNSFVPNQFFGGQVIERELTLRREGA
jgi:Flp pilus assembly protein TadG